MNVWGMLFDIAAIALPVLAFDPRSVGNVDLAVESVARVATPEVRGQSVRLKVTVANIGDAHMVPLASGTPSWYVSVRPVLAGTPESAEDAVPYAFRVALKAGERHSFIATVTLPCERESLVRVVVDPSDRYVEHSESNNRRAFPIAGNKCAVSSRR